MQIKNVFNWIGNYGNADQNHNHLSLHLVMRVVVKTKDKVIQAAGSDRGNTFQGRAGNGPAKQARWQFLKKLNME